MGYERKPPFLKFESFSLDPGNGFVTPRERALRGWAGKRPPEPRKTLRLRLQT